MRGGGDITKLEKTEKGTDSQARLRTPGGDSMRDIAHL